MKLLENAIALAVCALIFYGIYLLIGNKKYLHSQKWFKTPIAFALGAVAAILSTPAIRLLSEFLAFVTVVPDSTIGAITVVGGMVLGIAASIPVGLYVYFKLCAPTTAGVNVGRILYALLSIICVYNVYFKFAYEASMFEGALWISTIVLGIVVLINIDKIKAIQ